MARRSGRPLSDEWEQLELFRALPGDLAPRDAQDLMSYPFFSLAKSKRVTPIDFRMGEIVIKVEATLEQGMATIWDADVLIWAASQIVQARDNGLKYFALTGGLERWLYRLVRKHGGRQQYGWSFDVAYLHAKSGSLSPLKHFAYDVREIVRRQTLPGYRLLIERGRRGAERLVFTPILREPFVTTLRSNAPTARPGDKL